MMPENDWLAFSIFSQQKEWPRLLGVLNAFLNSGATRPLIAMRIIEFNHLNDSNIRLFILAAPGQGHPLTAQLQLFFTNNCPAQPIPGMQGKIPAGNNTILAIRVLLSDVIMEAFRIEPMNDETLLTVALYLHLALLKNNKAANTILSSFAGTAILIDDGDTITGQLDAEYSVNRELLFGLKSDVESNHIARLPNWLPVWINGYETILVTVPEHQLPSIYRSTLYFIIKQLGLAAPLITRLEYYIKKMAETEIINT